MEQHRFEELARAAATGVPRRRMLRLLGAALAGTVLAPLGRQLAEASGPPAGTLDSALGSPSSDGTFSQYPNYPPGQYGNECLPYEFNNTRYHFNYTQYEFNYTRYQFNQTQCEFPYDPDHDHDHDHDRDHYRVNNYPITINSTRWEPPWQPGQRWPFRDPQEH